MVIRIWTPLFLIIPYSDFLYLAKVYRQQERPELTLETGLNKELRLIFTELLIIITHLLFCLCYTYFLVVIIM